MQGVLVFASSAARAAAITSPQEGQYSYLKDTNSTEYYDGAAWIAAPIGDITGVTAGVGISGGGTSGTVTVTNSMATEITAAGDIIVGTGSGTFDNLPIGTTNQVLTADTTVSPYKVKWATPAGGGGKVLQVVQATYAGTSTITTTTLTDQGLSCSITPSSASSKVLVFVVSPNEYYRLAANMGMKMNLMRGSTEIWYTSAVAKFQGNNTTVTVGDATIPILYLDSPATTSSTTYKIQIAPTDSSSTGQVFTNNGGTATSVMVLMEIGA
jgi:hypothetical protein